MRVNVSGGKKICVFTVTEKKTVQKLLDWARAIETPGAAFEPERQKMVAAMEEFLAAMTPKLPAEEPASPPEE